MKEALFQWSVLPHAVSARTYVSRAIGKEFSVGANRA
jgi:hypothetical protein